MRLELEPRATAFPLVENDAFDDAFATTSWDFESLLKRGVAAAQSGDRDTARKLLSQATAINPLSEDAWMWLASISDYPEELLAFLNRVLEINPGNGKAAEWRSATTSLLAKNFVQRALAARNDGSFELAAKCLDQALTHDEECELAWFWKASLAESDDQKLDLYTRVLEINPENSEASTAVALIKQALTLASLEDAKKQAADGNRAKAIAILDQLVNHESFEVRELAWMTMCDVAESEDERLEFLNRVLDVNPGNQQAADWVAQITRARSMDAFDQAKSAAANGQRQKAVKILTGFLQEVPDCVEAWLLKSHLSPELDEKVEALERALELDPENAGARSGLVYLASTFKSSEQDEQALDFTIVEVDDEVHAMAGDNNDAQVEGASRGDDQDSDNSVESYLLAKTVEEAGTSASVEQGFDLGSQFDIEEEYRDDIVAKAGGNHILEPAGSAESVFEAAEQSDVLAEYGEGLSPIALETHKQNPFAVERDLEDSIAPYPFEQEIESAVFPLETATPTGQSNCPFCSASNNPQALACSGCKATLTLADLERLLSGKSADREAVQHAVTAMEAAWNVRDFSEAELTALSIGHFNLGNTDSGLKYLQEASRLNPNNVILAGHVNTIAIRLAEMQRQHENYDAMPKGKKILVVDDSPTVRKLISGKLEKSGHVVVCAVDGVDALAKLEEDMPDLVLLDITMPRMDGYEVCKQIRANAAGRNLPVVMISGKDGFFDKVRGRMAGTSGYVTKPFGPETLMKALETYLLPEPVEVT